MATSIPNTEHYKWGENCDGWHLLKSDTLSVIEETMPMGATEKLHYHKNAQQLFYILSGEALFELNGKVQILKAKESIHVPAKIAHRISNQQKVELRFLVISEPKTQGDRFEF